jgi:hypothetical protein
VHAGEGERTPPIPCGGARVVFVPERLSPSAWSRAALDGDTGDGMGNCAVDISAATLGPLERPSRGAFDPAVLKATAEPAVAADPVELELAIRPVDAIVVTGAAAIERPAMAAIPVPAAS